VKTAQRSPLSDLEPVAMARITISLSDQLKEDLELYAEQHELSVSKAVTLALQGFLPGQSDQDADLQQTQRYLRSLVSQLDELREAVHRMALAQYGPFAPLPEAVSQPLPPPTWSRAEEDGGPIDEETL